MKKKSGSLFLGFTFRVFVSFFLRVSFFWVFLLSMKNAREKTRAFEIVRTSHHGANVAKGTRHPDDVGGWVPLGNQERQLSNGKIRCVLSRIFIFVVVVVSFDRAMMMMMMMMMFRIREKPRTKGREEIRISLWTRKGGREGSKGDSRAEMCSTRIFAP